MGLLDDVIGLKEVKDDDEEEEEEDGLAVLLVVLPSNDAMALLVEVDEEALSPVAGVPFAMDMYCCNISFIPGYME